MPRPTSRVFSGRLIRIVALALVAAGPAMSAAPAGLVPQYSEDLRPTLTSKATTGAATLEFTAFRRLFRLQLSTNEPLTRLAAGDTVQLYRGSIEGAPGSWARIAIRDGLPRGMVWDGREMFIVDAPPDAVNDGAAGTVMFKLSDAVLERGVSLADDTVDAPRDAAAAYGKMVDELRANVPVSKAGAGAEGVKISILADASALARFASEAQARDAILTRLNNVDGIFSAQLGVELQVDSVDIADSLTAGFSATTDPSALLDELGQLRGRSSGLKATGLTHLFTGRDLNGNTAGIAYMLSLCSPRYASSLTMLHTSAALDALMVAHEIGHVFGAPHDGEQKCAATPQGQFIMTPTLDTSVSSFSQCSLEQINAVIDSYACVAPLPPSEANPPPPTGGGGDGGGGGSGGDGGDSGGGGSLDLLLLGMLLVVVLAKRLARANE